MGELPDEIHANAPQVSSEEIQSLLENLLGAAKRPFAIVGGSRWSEAGRPSCTGEAWEAEPWRTTRFVMQ